MAGDVSLVTSYRPKETVTVTATVAVVLAPKACFAAQGSLPGILMYSVLEVIGMDESDGFIIHHQCDAGHLVNGLGQEIPAFKMGAAEPFEVELLTAANMVLLAPMALLILGPKVT
uniref:Uncharacterized protein n=1 Tax=Romanomermis culicivorax TaxID=13658 RepID=A0A915JKY0_ROMCU